MTEICADDLRFALGEAAAFLNQVMGFDISTQDIAALETHTEGWIAGLQLAALSIQGLKCNDEITDLVNRITGSDRYIQDYLADEVLQQRPKGSKDFLLQTLILNSLVGSHIKCYAKWNVIMLAYIMQIKKIRNGLQLVIIGEEDEKPQIPDFCRH